MTSVTAGGPGLVAVGSDGDLEQTADAVVWTSVDGITWSRVPHDEEVFGGAGGQQMTSVTAAGPGLVAVGSDGLGSIDNGPAQVAAVWTSVDGITWSRVPHDEEVFGGVGGQQMTSVTVGGPGLVAVGSDGDAVVWTSVDGLTWSRVPHDEEVFGGAGGQQMTSVTAGGPGLVAVGSDGDLEQTADAAVWTSDDGITWSRVPHDEEVFGGERYQVMMSVTDAGPGLVAVGWGMNPGVWVATPEN
jgi:hypothetical protein